MGEFRLQRIEHTLRNEISSMIMSDEIKDPRVSTFVSITAVKVSKDMSHAKVYVSSFQSHRKIASSVDALNHASGFIQSRLSRRLHMRVTPQLAFVADRSIEEGFEITHKLTELSS